jgi:hypothetical protein
MSQKKLVGRSVAIALGIACIILLAGIGGVLAYYTMTINNKNTTYDSYASSHYHTNTEFNSLNTTYQDYAGSHTYSDSEYNSLQSTYNNYQSTHSHTDSEYDSLSSQNTNLQNQIASLEAPNLIRINLGESDNRPWLGTPYLHIQSAITNVGTNTAFNCKLHVVLYQGATIAKDTYVLLGTISGRAGISTTNDVQYSGSALTGWTITPQWTS